MNLMKWRCFFALFFFFPSFAIFAEPLILQEDQGKYPLGNFLEILEDPTGKLTFEEVSSPEFSPQFVPNEAEVPNFGFTSSAYWVRFEVANLTEKQDWLLELGYSNLEVELHALNASGAFEVKKGSVLLPFRQRELQNRNFVFQLPALSAQPHWIYLRVRGISDLTLPLTIWSNTAFLEKIQDEQYFLGGYYGIMAVMVAYNLFLFVSLRQRSYLFYVLYILSHILFQLSADGLAYKYLWSDSPQWNARGWAFFIFLTLSLAVLFNQNFLQTKQYAPLLHKILYGILALLLVGMLLVFLPNYAHIMQFSILLGLLAGVSFIISAGLCWKRGYQPARYYLLGWTVLIISADITALKSLGILPSGFLTEYCLHFGSALEVILLSLALADRLNLLEREKLVSEKEYRDLVENLNVGVIRINSSPESNIVKINSATLKIFGYDPSEVKNLHSKDLYQNKPDREHVLKTLATKGELKNHEVLGKHKDGHPIWVCLNATSHQDKQGNIQWIDSIVEDITQRKESEEKIQRLNDTFEKFVPQQFLKRIAQKGIDYIELGKAQTESLSVLFADIRAFTQLSESVSPQETLDFLNTYLAEVNQPIQNCHGFIDKFIGDGIMALFDRPTHATDSFHAAVAMTQAIRNFNQERAQENLPTISIGIAIHSGSAIIGTVGTRDRMDSTVLGDTVNLAARMESLTKYYNAQIIISLDTHETIVDESLLCRELDFIAVKGKKIPKTIFEVFNGDEAEILEKKQKILVPYAKGLSLYRARHWKEAIGLFEECLKIYPEDAVSQMYIERCHQFQQTPPDASWRGETRMH